MPQSSDALLDAPVASVPRLAAAFVCLFAAYHGPEVASALAPRAPWIHDAGVVAFLPLAWVVARVVLRAPAAAAFALGPVRPLAPCLGVGLGAKAASLAVLARAGAVALQATTAPPLAILGSVIGALVQTFFPSLAEDILTRGLLARARAWRFSSYVAASAAVYVANHLHVWGQGPWQVARLLAFGLAYAAALFRTRSLWAAVGLHWGWNAAGALADSLADVQVRSAEALAVASTAVHLAIFVGLAARPSRRDVTPS